MLERCDFHVHYCSDEPEENQADSSFRTILEKAKKTNTKALALIGRLEIGSHETIALAKKMFAEAKIDVSFGLEYYARLPENFGSFSLVDLICLDFDHQDPEIISRFGKEGQRKRNMEIATQQLIKLKEIGFCLEPEEDKHQELLEKVMAGKIAAKAISFCEIIASLGEQNIVPITNLERRFSPFDKRKYDKKNDHTPLANWLYDRLFRPPDGLAYFPVQRPVEEIIDTIHKAGGVVLYSPENQGYFRDDVMEYLLERQIDGIMAWHGGKMEVPISWIKKLRRENKLILGGSDFDPEKDDWQPGIGKGEMFISIRRREDLLRYQDINLRP